MKLHIFNPEHDLALAAGIGRFTPPRAVRQLRADVGFLPALWADEGDWVLVDDAETAAAGFERFKAQGTSFELREVAHLGWKAPEKAWTNVRFVPREELCRLVRAGHAEGLDGIFPWGWDAAVADYLRGAGLGNHVPSDRVLGDIRRLSNRCWAAEHLLSALLTGHGATTQALSPTEMPQALLVGKARLVGRKALEALGGELLMVVKAPWSCSGRGVRFVMDGKDLERNRSWMASTIDRQGGIMVEPYYERVVDFGMEFECGSEGIDYRGLSLFSTWRGAYRGGLIASEEAKRDRLSPYISLELIDGVRRRIMNLMAGVLGSWYVGPFGVDMMVVSVGEGLCLHPCVELNLRRTMGHVALSLPSHDGAAGQLMRLSYRDGHGMGLEVWDETM